MLLDETRDFFHRKGAKIAKFSKFSSRPSRLCGEISYIFVTNTQAGDYQNLEEPETGLFRRFSTMLQRVFRGKTVKKMTESDSGASLPKDLHTPQAFSTGQVPDECIDILVAAYPNKIFRDGTSGVHTCSLCTHTQTVALYPIQWRGQTITVKGFGHYLVQMDKIVYMAPALLLHYICEHRYCPPQEFVYAMVHGKFLTEDDLDIKWEC